eukprot:14884503-Ditylum_brightwellii.AAC.1
MSDKKVACFYGSHCSLTEAEDCHSYALLVVVSHLLVLAKLQTVVLPFNCVYTFIVVVYNPSENM